MSDRPTRKTDPATEEPDDTSTPVVSEQDKFPWVKVKFENDKPIWKTWLLLTYSIKNTPLNKATIATDLSHKKADKYMIIEETGKNGTFKHHHAIVHFKKQILIRNKNYFNISFGDTTVQTEISDFPKKDLNNVIGYCLKEDKTPELFNFKKDLEAYRAKAVTGTITRKTNVGDLKTVIGAASTRQEAYEQVAGITSLDAWPATKSVIDSTVSESRVYSSLDLNPLYSMTEYNYPKELLDWFKVFSSGVKLGRYPVILITGDSGTCKTSALKAFGPHMFFRERIVWQDIFFGIPEEAKYILFDDIKPDHLNELTSHKALLCGMHGGFCLDIKYENVTQVKVEIPSVIIANEAPKWIADKYWKANTLWLHIEDNMRKKKHPQSYYKILNVPTVEFSVLPGYPTTDLPILEQELVSEETIYSF